MEKLDRYKKHTIRGFNLYSAKPLKYKAKLHKGDVVYRFLFLFLI